MQTIKLLSLFSSYHSKIISTPKQKHVTSYSTPAPVLLTTTEAHDSSTQQSVPIIQSRPTVLLPTTSESSEAYDYDEAIIYQKQTAIVTPRPIIVHSSSRPQTYATNQIYEPHQVEDPQRYEAHEEPPFVPIESKPLPDFGSSSLAEILTKLQQTNHLPETITPDNVDNSIKTLVKILNNLKETQTIQKVPEYNNQADDYDYSSGSDSDGEQRSSHWMSNKIILISDTIQDGSPGPNSGRPGIDYPNFHEIPPTTFSCKDVSSNDSH